MGENDAQNRKACLRSVPSPRLGRQPDSEVGSLDGNFYPQVPDWDNTKELRQQEGDAIPASNMTCDWTPTVQARQATVKYRSLLQEGPSQPSAGMSRKKFGTVPVRPQTGGALLRASEKSNDSDFEYIRLGSTRESGASPPRGSAKNAVRAARLWEPSFAKYKVNDRRPLSRNIRARAPLRPGPSVVRDGSLDDFNEKRDERIASTDIIDEDGLADWKGVKTRSRAATDEAMKLMDEEKKQRAGAYVEREDISGPSKCDGNLAISNWGASIHEKVENVATSEGINLDGIYAKRRKREMEERAQEAKVQRERRVARMRERQQEDADRENAKRAEESEKQESGDAMEVEEMPKAQKAVTISEQGSIKFIPEEPSLEDMLPPFLNDLERDMNKSKGQNLPPPPAPNSGTFWWEARGGARYPPILADGTIGTIACTRETEVTPIERISAYYDAEQYEIAGDALYHLSPRYIPTEDELAPANQHLLPVQPIRPPSPRKWDSNRAHMVGPVEDFNRYMWYIEEGIDVRLLAPFKETWLKNAYNMIRRSIGKHRFNSRYEDIMVLEKEVRHDYEISVKKSIVNYVLKNPTERRRLEIEHLIPEHQSNAERGVVIEVIEGPDGPAKNHEHVVIARTLLMESLFIFNSAMVALLSLAVNFGKIELFDFSGLAWHGPPHSIEEFKEMHISHGENERKRMVTKWYPKVVEVFRLTPKPWSGAHKGKVTIVSETGMAQPVDLTDEEAERWNEYKLERYLASAHSLVGSQLRSIVERNAAEFAKHFAVYALSNEASKNYSPSKRLLDAPPLFHMKLIPHPTGTRATPTFDEVENTILSVYDTTVASLNYMPTLETELQITKFLNAKKANSKYIKVTYSKDDENILEHRNMVQQVVVNNLAIVRKLMRMYTEFNYLLKPDTERSVDEFLSQKRTAAEYSAEYKKWANLAKSIEDRTPARTDAGLFSVHLDEVKNALMQRAEQLGMAVLTHFFREQIVAENERINDQYLQAKHKLKTVPENITELAAAEEYLMGSSKNARNLISALQKTKMLLTKLLQHPYFISEKEMDDLDKIFRRPQELQQQISQARQMLMEVRRKLEGELNDEKAEFEKYLESVQKELEKFDGYSDMDETQRYLQEIEDMHARFKSCYEILDDIQARETTLGYTPQEFPILSHMEVWLEPYEKMWTTADLYTKSMHKWKDGALFENNADTIEDDVLNLYAALKRVAKTLGNKSGAGQLAEQLSEKVDTFKEDVPVIQTLCSKALRDRHWSQIKEIVGFDVRADPGITLMNVIDLGIKEHLHKLEPITETANKEYAIEQALDKMVADWEPLVFKQIPYKRTETCVVGDIAEVQQTLDDQVMKTQTILSSSFIKPFEARAKQWLRKLLDMQDIIDCMLKVQSGWMYLQPVFGSPEIMKQMPDAGKTFQQVDRAWKRFMQDVQEDNHVTVATDSQGLLGRLLMCQNKLESVMAVLNDYLESKRQAFPRFYFLSNDELLEILAEARDPLAVQPHLKKCFEGIYSLDFQENLEITAMKSPEGEVVELSDKVLPVDYGGQVEGWLLEVEHQMFASVHTQIARSYIAYPRMTRTEWLQHFPGMCVLTTSQIVWTAEVSKAIKHQGLPGLIKYHGTCNENLLDIVELVRGNLEPLVRKTVEAMIVIEVHARDVVNDMIEASVEDLSDFEWICQLRYYWIEESVSVRMINASLTFGYEYLGNSSRLVITPLTDRCYRTLTGALHLNLGGAPEGPAGTGKTETTKDLSKALAKQCVVFNCSDGLDYIAMGKFFKGLASCGAWACFDEFNRIDVEVLSVVAQQILTIQRAVTAGDREFMFEGVNIKLNDQVAVFITMNPGYAGRSDLPDNLKALFRPVAMMVPDYAMISEIILYSFGYIEARVLAKKIVATYKLCSEQLSSQEHYDYGMRAVISVLRAAGNFKRESGNVAEASLILRSIRSVNEPKFLAHDIPLFEGILSDLFHDVNLPDPDYELFWLTLKTKGHSMGIQVTQYVQKKVTELYEMVKVRHGLMTVGAPFGGKTTFYRLLASVLTELKQQGSLLDEREVEYSVVNPKSIPIARLYGQFDPASHEWSDGVLAKLFRGYASSTAKTRKWLIFDGPVDAVWIENMNTVLDDNKKLCLMSGEIIKMNESMNLIFEVADLAVASPATVSRCGMVYVEPDQIGWKPLYHTWVTTVVPSYIYDVHKKLIDGLFDWLVPLSLSFIRRECSFPCPVLDTNLVVGLMNLMESLLLPLMDQDYYAKLDQRGVQTRLEGWFYFSLVWSMGAVTDRDGRNKYSTFVSRMINSTTPPVKVTVPFPMKHTVYDWVFTNPDGSYEWVYWMDTIERQPIPEKALFNDIIVDTNHTCQVYYLLDILVKVRKNLLFVGPSGTGKSMIMKRYLNNRIDKEKYSWSYLLMSAQISAGYVQDQVEAPLFKVGTGTYGPPPGTHHVFLVDDMNMPRVETYGAQPPIELLRQWMDHKGWFEKEGTNFRNIERVLFAAAMGPPGGGRNHLSQRYLRHFNTIVLLEYDDENLHTIFSVLMNWYFETFEEEIKVCINPMIAATMEVYKVAMTDLLPTPAKSHYTFNLRDFSKVVQGIMLSSKESMMTGTGGASECIRLWCHEVLRVFYDRLVEDHERMWFLELMKDLTQRHFKMNFDVLFAHLDSDKSGDVDADELRRLFFGMYSNDLRMYDEIEEPDEIKAVMENYLQEHNKVSHKPMNLVIFLYAIEHISRICRVIMQPGGHMLLVGVGGSGRKSLTKLAAHIVDLDVFEIVVTKSYQWADWREDVKKALKKAGAVGRPTVFLFSDTQVKDEAFLEDVDSILNSGDVPNLFHQEEMESLLDLCKKVAPRRIENQKPALKAFFHEQCRSNLHMVICMSPVGSAFRDRLRLFPSLVNCCTIDWFREWPDDALMDVAMDGMNGVDFGKDETLVQNVCQAFIFFHTSAHSLAGRYHTQARRYNYVTPTNFLDLLSSFKKLLAKKRAEIKRLKMRYVIGLERLDFTESQVSTMREELENLKPNLMKTQEQTDELMAKIKARVPDIERKKAQVKEEEDSALMKAEEAKRIRDECEEELAKALPILENALKALDTIKQPDIVVVKSLRNPPTGVRLVMEAVCVMLNKPPDRKLDANTGKTMYDYWGPSKQIMGDSHFIDILRDYDKDNIDPKILNKVRKEYLPNPEFTPERVRVSSQACEGLCNWIRALEQYDGVIKLVKPKQQMLAQAEQAYQAVMEALEMKRQELVAVENEMKKLEDELLMCNHTKKGLEDEVALCEKKLMRAEQLIEGLGGEKDRWFQTAENLENRFQDLTGDCLLAAGTIAYLGVYTPPFRIDITKQWIDKIRELELPFSLNYSLKDILGEPARMRQWALCGLPNDDFSMNNGIIVSNANRYPLLIDPQGQAVKWLKNLYEDNRQPLKMSKISDKDFLRVFEGAVQFGLSLLIDNLHEELDPAMEGVLCRQTFKSGGNTCVMIGDNTVSWTESFRLYMATALRNPHYLPEVTMQVCLVNFMITPLGLEDQLLGIVVQLERPDLEEQRNKLIHESAQNKKELEQIENRILEVLSDTKGNILEDEGAINQLNASKNMNLEIEEKQRITEETEKEIQAARLEYRGVAFHGSVLFFSLSDMANLEWMYQFSLGWFVDLYQTSMTKTEANSDMAMRIAGLIADFTYAVFVNVSRGLLEKDKIIFPFMMAVDLLKSKNILPDSYMRFFLTGLANPLKEEDVRINPCTWLSEKQWTEIQGLATLEGFSRFDQDFISKSFEFKKMYDHPAPHTVPLPGKWEACDPFQKLLVLRCIRADKVVPAVQEFIGLNLGQTFLDFPRFDVAESYENSKNSIPLLFVLSEGSDVMTPLLKFAESKFMTSELDVISLGQGQGPIAEKLIRTAKVTGRWVVLQNCHLAVSWLPILEQLLDEMQEEMRVDVKSVHENFRLWLTSYPTDKFPASIIQASVKMTNEPPKGIRNNMLANYMMDPISDYKFFNSVKKEKIWRRLLFSLCMFHAVVQERRVYGPVGWNVPYGFNSSDLYITVKQLHNFLNDYNNVPLKTLLYTAGECNYGGRVTDVWDRRCLNTTLREFYNEATIHESKHSFSDSGLYHTLDDENYIGTLEYVRGLPLITEPEAVGLHSNADMSKDIRNTESLWENFLTAKASEGGGGGSGEGHDKDAIVQNLAEGILKNLPPDYDMQLVTSKYPMSYHESMNTVLAQELQRYNRLLGVIRASLTEMLRATNGLVVMSADLERLSQQLYAGQLPAQWMRVSYPSRKPLGPYVTELYTRLAMYKEWMLNEPPNVYWMNLFFFPHAFLTGICQNFARKNQAPIDEVVLDFEALSVMSETDRKDMKAAPVGAYVDGIWLEGARWSNEDKRLAESEPKVLFSPAPMILLKPVFLADVREFPHYECPLYRTSDRRGTLSTTGHSTNFIMALQLDSDRPQSHWIRRGVGALCGLDY